MLPAPLTIDGAAPGSGRCAVVTPHLDDAVLSCGHLIGACPGTVVVTVFGGAPPSGLAPTNEDTCGLSAADEAVTTRRIQDAAACDVLGATARFLPFDDERCGESRGLAAIVAAIGSALDDADVSHVVVPLGLFHRDHETASDAALCAATARRTRLSVLVYAEWPHRSLEHLTGARFEAFRRTGATLSPVEPEVGGDLELKRRAVSCYRSQRRAYERRDLLDLDDCLAPEPYWSVRWT